MLRRVRTPRYILKPLHGFSYPKTTLEKQYEAMDELQEAVKYKRYTRTPQPALDSKIRKLRPPPDRAISHNLSYTLRHGASKQGLQMRTDGFAKVTDLLALPPYHSINFSILERIVKEDGKNRYTLKAEPGRSTVDDVWWIRANQGHSLTNVVIETTPITSPDQIPMAVHGTSKEAWERIAIEGLSRMNRLHVHFAQGLAGPKVVSGMRRFSQIYIYLDVPLVLESGMELMLSSNGVVLCPGDERGVISPRFFGRVEWAGNLQAIQGWEGPRQRTSTPPGVDTAADDKLTDA